MSRKPNGARAGSLAALAVAVLVVLLVSMVLGAAPARGQYIPGPNVITPEPDPYLEGNATVSTHATGNGPLEYPTGTTYGNLSARLDPNVFNPVVVSPNDIVAPGVLQGNKVCGAYWNVSASWTLTGASTGGMVTTGPTLTTVNGEPAIQFTANATNHAGSNQPTLSFTACAVANWPSANNQFDYVTAILASSGTAPSGSVFGLGIKNSSNAGYATLNAANGAISPVGSSQSSGSTASAIGNAYYISAPLSALSKSSVAGYNTSGAGLATQIQLQFQIAFGAGTGATADTFTILGLEFSTSPFYLGQTYWKYTLAGASAATQNLMYRGLAFGTDNLTSLSPTQAYTSVVGGGYTVAIVQSANDLPAASVTATSNAVSVANATSGGPSYVEQVTYDYAFGLPIASGVTYGSFKLVDEPVISGAQYAVVTIGGTAYTTTYQTFLPETVHTVIASLSATTTTYWIGVVYYTGPQWDSISQAPGIFSSTGLEYWWFVLIGAILALAGTSSAWVVSNQRALKGRRGAVALPGQGPRRRLGNERGTSGRHVAAITLGLVFIGAAAIALWAIYDGADALGAAGSFIAGLIILLAVAAIAFVGYEIAHRVRHRKRRG